MTEQMTRPEETAPTERRLPLPVPRNAQGTLPLSSLQEQLWFLDRLAPGRRAYNVSRTFRLAGPVDVAALERAFGDVVRRHEILRTVFAVDDTGPVQKVLAQGQARLAVDDLRSLPEDRREAEALRRAEETIRAPYDIERGPLVRLQLLRLAEEDHLLVLGLHHTCADGWSRPIFWRDLAAYYNAHLEGRPADLAELPLQFGDFAVWQRRLIESPEFQPHLEYWIEHLRGLQPLELVTDRPRPTTPTFDSDSITTTLDRDVLDGLRALAERSNGTLLMVLLAVFKAVLARHTGQSEIVIGTATTGRPMQELAPLVGPFINILVLRTDVSGDPTFAELLERTKQTTVEAWQHRSVPFEQVVGAVQPERDPSRNPLYQVGLQLLDASTSDAVAPPQFQGLQLEEVEVEVHGHPLELSLTATMGEHGLDLHADYATDLFDRARIARLLAHLERVIRAVVADDGLRVSELPLHTDEERRLLLDEWGVGPVAEQPSTPVHVQVAERAAADPEAVAARLDGVELTFGELERRAGLLARRLRELGVSREDVVAVALERGPDLLVALLGVLKAGGAFVMLDADHPNRRLRFILDDTQAGVVLTSSALAGRLPEPDGRKQLCVDVDSDWLPVRGEAPLDELADEHSLAYVLYTSGSTGQPKGVLVEHHALTTFIRWLGGEFGFGPGDRFAQHMALIFDFAIGEIFAALTTGATLVFVPEEERAEPAAFGELLERERITYLGGPPAVLGSVEVRDLPDLRVVIAGGEALPGEVVNRWRREGRRFIDGYGPTEAAVGCVFYDCGHRDWKGQPPIGRPMPRRYAYILDAFGGLCPIGVPGELVIGGIGGAGLARGYLNHPELTAERFLDDPLRPGGRYYRTGDLAVWSEEGQIEFLGRIDAQVKLNGLRIELEEIESVLQTHPDVAAAAVSVQGETAKQLVGYVVSGNGELDAAALRSFLSEELPHYMIPSRFVQLEQLPLTSVGKIDRPALPQTEPDEAEVEAEYVAPSTLTEKLVAAIFETMLGREHVGANDNFFALGGTSLQAARSVLQLREQLGVEIAVRDFYAAPRVADVAQTIERARAAEREAGAEKDELVIPKRPDRSRAPLSCTQEQLWFLDQLTPGRATYNLPVVMRFRGALDVGALDQAVAALAVRHEAFRTGFTVEDGRPVQVIEEPSADVRLAVEDCSELAPDALQERLHAWLKEQAERPFDLSHDRMFRGGLLRLAPDEHVLALVFHHMCFDGWSAGVVAGELRRFYALALEGEPLPTEEPPLQYADFSAWQQEQLSSGVLERQVEYWAERLKGAEPLEIPSDRPRPEVPTNRGARLVYAVPVEVLEEFRALAQRHGVTLFAALLAAVKAVLSRWTGQEDVVIGTTTPGRRSSQLEQLVGCLINMIVLRTDVSGNPTFAELIARSMATVSDAWNNDQAPFEKVVERVGAPRDASRNPLFLFGIDLQSEDVRDFGLAGVDTEFVPIDPGTSRFDVAINTYEGPSGLVFRVEYSTDLFEASRIERLLQQIERVIRAAVVDDGLRLSELPLNSEEERELMLEEWGRGAELDQPRVPVHAQVAERAAAQPGAVAARIDGREITYGELEERAGRLARRLRELGVGHQDIVAVALERGPELLVALVGVLKAGAAFVMLDPEHPPRRLTYILDDTQARIVLTSSAIAASLPEAEGLQRLCADVDRDWQPADANAPLEALADEHSLAYVLYTSGSTGQPKGVLVEHHALSTFLLWWRSEFGFGPGDRLMQHMALIFDFAVGEMFGALTSGATLVFVPEEERTDPARFSQLLAQERATYLGGPPAVLGSLEVQDLPDLRVMIAGGEALPGEVVNRWRREGRRFINGYGPTEATVGCVFFDCAGRTWRGQPPIGRPMPRRYAYVLDHLGQPCPIGVPGELVMGGDGLARGYLNQLELTAQKFVDDPFREGGRFYRTGDLAVWSEEGQLEFLGRIDAQVKLNGLRIELEEIESVLQLHPDVAAAAVSVQGEAAKQLVGFVVSSNGELDQDVLRAFLSEELPHYMIPSQFVQLEQLPLTSVGKIDRAALPQTTEEGDDADEPEFVAASTPTEKQVAAIFGEILGEDEIGVHDNFFTVGGTSLQAARAVLQLRQQLGVEVAVRDFYAAPRIADVAQIIDEARGGQPEDGAPELDARRREIEELRKRLAEAEAELEATEAGQAPPPTSPAEIVIERREDSSRAPLAFTQEQLWFLDQLNPGRSTYNIAVVMRLRGTLDQAAAERAVSALVERHEPMRTRLAVEDGQPLQVIEPAGDFHLPKEDWSARPEGEREQALREWLAAEADHPFDLSRDLMFRSSLLRLAPEDHVLALTFHHSCFDGVSAGVVADELRQLYDLAVAGKPVELPESVLQFGDYAAWQQEQHRNGELERHVQYWEQKLKSAPQLELPSDRPRPEVASNRGDRMNYAVPVEVLEQFRDLARRRGVTLFAALLAATKVVLSRWSGQDDIVIGTTSPNRRIPQLERLVGCLINMIVLRTDLSGNPTFAELLGRTMTTLSESWDHETAPFEKVVERLGVPKDTSRNPIFQFGIDLQNESVRGFQLSGCEVEFLSVNPQTSRFDVAINTYEGPSGLVFQCEYATDLFDRSRIERFFQQMELVIRAAIADDSLRVSELPLIGEAERRRMMDEWGRGPDAEQSRAPVHVQISERAASDPDGVAARLDGAELTYGDLERRAGLLARRLRELGVGREDVVAVALERGADLLVAFLGVLKAGGAFVMLDSGHPHRRLRFLLEDTQAKAVLTSSEVAPRLPEPDGWVRLSADVEGEWLPADRDASLDELADEHSLAYVLYTSGSTGQPKGVLVEHHALTTFILWLGGEFGFGPGDRFAQHMALIFDFAIGEIFTAMATGATLAFVPEAVRVDPAAFGELLERERITYMGGPPAVLGSIEAGDLPHLRVLIAGGEALPGEVVNRWRREGRRFINGYGPTEAAVGCVFYDCAGRAWRGQPPIGRPMPRRYGYILDRFGQLCPVGVPGELVIGGIDGAGLARGYLNQPELTAERFLDDPFRAGGRYYRTGDLAVWSEEGQIEFLGRIDAQVKLNGLRIELEEIESVLQAHPDVAAAAVTVQGETAKQLVGYVVSGNGELDPTALRSFLSEELPHYMIPSRFVQLDQLPLTTVGKIDRAALAGATDQEEEAEAEVEYVAPATEAEREVAAVFAEVLERDRVGAQDSFFALGGSSLQAAKAVLRLRQVLEVEFPLRLLYANPTVAAFAAAVQAPELQADGDGTSAAASVAVGELPPRPALRLREVLLTGVTGFFGAFLLEQILELGEAHVHCLVRASSDAEAWERLRASLHSRGIERDDLGERVSVVRGDLGQPRLGIADDMYARLAGSVDAIYHSGAHVDLLFPYAQLEGVNVGGTRSVVELATTEVLKEIHFVSTVSARRGADFDPSIYGYATSKWQAERVLVAAQGQGVPAAIYRLPRLAGDTRTGRGNDRDIVGQLVRRFAEMGVAPELELEEEWVPADQAARVLVETATASPEGGLFTIMPPSRVRIRELIDLVAETGVPVAIKPPAEFMEEILVRFPEDKEIMSTILAPPVPIRESGLESGHPGAVFTDVAAPGIGEDLLRRYAEVLGGRVDAELSSR